MGGKNSCEEDGRCGKDYDFCRKKECDPAERQISQQTMRDLCLRMFAGRWYPIAKYNHPWETKCSSTVCDLVWDCDSSTMSFETTCFSDSQRTHQIEKTKGTLHLICPEEKGKFILTMDAPPSPTDTETSWPYFVHFTDYENYAIVGGPSGQYVWVYSRFPSISACDIKWILKKVDYFGYCSSRLLANPAHIIPCDCSSCKNRLAEPISIRGVEEASLLHSNPYSNTTSM